MHESLQRVSISVNGKVSVQEAALMLECSLASIYNLKNSGRLTSAQKIGGEWYFNTEENNRAKASNLITPRKRKSKVPDDNIVKASSQTIAENTDAQSVTFKIPKEQFARIKLALAATGKTPVQFVQEAFANLDEKI